MPVTWYGKHFRAKRISNCLMVVIEASAVLYSYPTQQLPFIEKTINVSPL